MIHLLIAISFLTGASWATPKHLTNQLIQGMSGETQRQAFDERTRKLANLNNLLSAGAVDKPKAYAQFRCLLKEYQSQYSLLKKERATRGDVSADTDAKLRQAKLMLREMSRAKNISPSTLTMAVDCHEVFAALENILEDPSKRPLPDSDNVAVGSTPSEVALIYGDEDRRPQKKVRKPDASEVPEYDRVIVVSQSVAVQHGIDKLIDRE